MIESKYTELLYTIRNFTNSINRDDEKQRNDVLLVLSEIINHLNFILKDDIDCKKLENRLMQEMRKFSKEIFEKTNNKRIYMKKMQRNIDYLAWLNKAKQINKNSRKYTVAQKEVYFAYLGDNIGSEQNGRRPVIILQNDIGNSKGNTTIIAPVTTHQKRIKWDNEKRKYYIEIMENSIEKRKYLDFYEVPLRLEVNPSGLYGFVNVMHLREIDRKRIDGHCVGIATDKCYTNIINAIKKNLS